jgi:hypothetical protein
VYCTLPTNLSLPTLSVIPKTTRNSTLTSFMHFVKHLVHIYKNEIPKH